MSWYYVVGSERKGPVGEADLDILYRKGAITPETLVWSAGLDAWKSYRIARQAAAQPSPALTGAGLVTCAISGRTVPSNAAIPIEGLWVSAEFKEQALQCIREGVPLNSTRHFAGFWIRFVAMFIDGIVLNICSMPVMFIFGMLLSMAGLESETVQILIFIFAVLLGLVLAAIYEIVLVAKNGATVGKMACGLKIIGSPESAGKSISYGKSTGRYFGKILGYFTLTIGYIMTVFDEEKRALHDRLSDTWVIHI